jgi:hypothetical protein
MDWLLAFVSAWWWLGAGIVVLVVVVALFAGSKGPHPKIVIHDEEKTFEEKSGGYSFQVFSQNLFRKIDYMSKYSNVFKERLLKGKLGAFCLVICFQIFPARATHWADTALTCPIFLGRQVCRPCQTRATNLSA